MASPRLDLSADRWRRSSYSNGDGGSCVEVGTSAAAGIIPTRDTKTAPTGPALTFPCPQWTRFISALHNGEISA